tara:strand:+ start:383 stop:1513 length:1131 start_codon:yes stop_codon:yes gene_type:complete
MRQKLFFLAFFCCSFLDLSHGHAIDLNSKQAFLIDLTTNTVLFEKEAETPVPPSSMSKLMTAYLVFKELKAGRLMMKDHFLVSKKAWKKGGSRMFLNVNSRVSVADLLRGLIVQSGNDAAITLAEGIMGDESAFAEQMTRQAREMGANTSTFKNATGWPDDGHLSTMKDLAIIAQRTIQNFPEYYSLYGETEFTYNKIRQKNRNPLLYANIGADGLKTGHTDVAGHGVVASALQGGRRLILAINGAKTKAARSEDAKKLMAWGFTYFASPKLFNAYNTLEHADVWLGKETNVPMVIDEDVYITVPRYQLKDVSVELVYNNPIQAPVKAGQVIGKVVIAIPGRDLIEKPLTAGRDVERAGFLTRIKAAFSYLLWGHN